MAAVSGNSVTAEEKDKTDCNGKNCLFGVLVAFAGEWRSFTDGNLFSQL